MDRFALKKSIPVLLAVTSLLILFMPQGGSYYNPWTNQIVCQGRKECIHEIGHMVDQKTGWVSGSEAYIHDVIRFIDSEKQIPPLGRHPWFEYINAYPGIIFPLEPNSNITTYSFWHGGWGGPIELYADMLRWADGDFRKMPSPFLKFYNWDIVNSLMDEFVE